MDPSDGHVPTEGDTPRPRRLAESAGASYAALIEAQLIEERLRKNSLEARGMSIMTTVSVMVGLLFGIGALFTGTDKFDLHDDARPFLSWALGLLVVSAILGLLVNVPMKYNEAHPDELKRLILNSDDSLGPYWDDDEFVGSMRVAEINVAMLQSARQKNGIKALLLLLAQGAQLIGVGLLAYAVAGTV